MHIRDRSGLRFDEQWRTLLPVCFTCAGAAGGAPASGVRLPPKEQAYVSVIQQANQAAAAGNMVSSRAGGAAAAAGASTAYAVATGLATVATAVSLSLQLSLHSPCST